MSRPKACLSNSGVVRAAFAAATYLRTLHDVRPDQIGVIGFCHSGWAALKAVLISTVRRDQIVPFAAAVAFYPGCQKPDSGLTTDTLILIGDADDWTPVDACRRWFSKIEKNSHALEMKVYPGALYGFDAPHAPYEYAGHFVGRDPETAEDAVALAQQFLLNASRRDFHRFPFGIGRRSPSTNLELAQRSLTTASMQCVR